MNLIKSRALVCAIVLSMNALFAADDPASQSGYWLDAMKRVHARFTGSKGTFAQFGDSISFTMAFWAPMTAKPRHMDQRAASAYERVAAHIKPECWSRWKGPGFGNQGSMTVRWAHANIGQWLTNLNPETAVIMFGSNDVGQMDVVEYEQKTREVVRRCLQNGTIVLLTTAPPRSGRLEKSQSFAEAIRKIAREEKVPCIDYLGEILKRRPDDWDGALPQFKGVPGDEYQVPTLLARDGIHPSNSRQFVNDFSEEALSRNGFSLRNHLTLIAYADVIYSILKN